MRRIPALALVIAGTMLFAGCHTTKLDENPQIEDHSATSGTTTGGGDTTSGGTIIAPPPGEQPAFERSVYFDFDSYVIKDQYKSVLTANSKYLSNKGGSKILIQGNTDERGGSEYNLALGQKRAEAVRRSLSALGVPDSQMEATSLGKEKPKALGHDEDSWAQNRRADIVY